MDTTYGHAVSLAVPVFSYRSSPSSSVVDRVRGTRYFHHLADALNSLELRARGQHRHACLLRLFIGLYVYGMGPGAYPRPSARYSLGNLDLRVYLLRFLLLLAAPLRPHRRPLLGICT